MGAIVPFATQAKEASAVSQVIDVAAVINSKRQLDASLISPAKEEVNWEVVEDHSADPIKSLDDINKISEYLINKGKYRDNMLFIVGINLGLRVSDLRKLTFSHLIDDQFRIRHSFPILEQKTSTTRKTRRNRYLVINDAVVDAVTLYLQHCPSTLSDYMFRSVSNNGSAKNEPLRPQSINEILHKTAEACGITAKVSSHSLRKTFGYHQMVMSGNSPRKLLVLQKIFGHSTAAQTLDYIGITSEEIDEAYMNLNLGSKQCYQRFSVLSEDSIA